MERAKSGKLYKKGKNIIVVFTFKPNGVALTVIDKHRNTLLGYVFLTPIDIRYLLREWSQIIHLYKIGILKERRNSPKRLQDQDKA